MVAGPGQASIYIQVLFSLAVSAGQYLGHSFSGYNLFNYHLIVTIQQHGYSLSIEGAHLSEKSQRRSITQSPIEANTLDTEEWYTLTPLKFECPYNCTHYSFHFLHASVCATLVTFLYPFSHNL